MLKKELTEEEKKLESNEKLSWDELLRVSEIEGQRLLNIMDELINWLPDNEKAYMNFTRALIRDRFSSTGTLILLAKMTDYLDDKISSVVSDIAKIKGEDVGGLRAKLDSISKELTIIKNSEKLSVTKVFQQIRGDVYGKH